MTNFDVIIIGTGIAGLFTALKVEEKYNVLLITKGRLEDSNSYLAQGGIAALGNQSIHYEDTLKAGCYYNNKDAVKTMVAEAKIAVEDLIKIGVVFDRDVNGELRLTREGGHRQSNILHVKDETGKAIISSMYKEIKNKKNIRIIENAFADKLMKYNNKITGIEVIETDGNKLEFSADAIVMATGGAGQIYGNTTNSIVSTGDGIAMAYRAGAIIADMELIQFHPTAFFEDIIGQRLLISEAVRGEGAFLRSKKGRAFMAQYHKMKDLAPRDIVARAIFHEMIKEGEKHVYLDITHKRSSFIKNRFPMIYNKCLLKGIDITKDWIPIAPAAHYLIGGIKTDLHGRTNIKGLYACGECAYTGVHGANRLASNSLLEGVVFARRTAIAINSSLKGKVKKEIKNFEVKTKSPSTSKNNAEVKDLDRQLKDVMEGNVAIIRNEKSLKEAYSNINKLSQRLFKNPRNTVEYKVLSNKLAVAKLIVEDSLSKKKSLGVHYRSDEIIEEVKQ
ncbi:L-aspartate oxidase [Alkaliphilus peptidifermentans]|uniref:L-aspartate oxidase n=1 Tax=Alkaliphilus peptidifermentans DSM 18978 TaxID=1120976 RepID=A0A1G5AXK5_9FIRM|nr:L-aspartate oxidase [Alkaliphilus peptidifermentans]SCX82617.1 L-aspartate oxidase [Alkaliphilus peptidifermentans DSM 18978]